MADADLTEKLSKGKTEGASSATVPQRMESGEKSLTESKPEIVEKSGSLTVAKVKCRDTEGKLKTGSSSIESKLADDFTTTDESSEQIAAAKTEYGDQQSTESMIGDSSTVLKVSLDYEEKSEESSTLTDKSSESATSKAKKGVDALVDKFRSIGSPKKAVAEDVKDTDLSREKDPMRTKLALSPVAESSKVSRCISTADVESSPTASHTTEKSKSSQEELTPPKVSLAIGGGEPQLKRSPLKNIIEKCRDLMGSPKKGHEIEQTGESSTENRPTSLELHTSTDVLSKKFDKNLLKSVFHKTRRFIQGRISSQLSEDSSSSSDSERHYLDTPHSGVLGDVSDASTSTMTGSPSVQSTENVIEEPESKIAQPEETAIEAPRAQPEETAIEAPRAQPEETAIEAPRAQPEETAIEAPRAQPEETAIEAPRAQPAANPQLKMAKEQDVGKMAEKNVGEMTPKCPSPSFRKRTPPLQRQKKIQEVSPDDSDETTKHSEKDDQKDV